MPLGCLSIFKRRRSNSVGSYDSSQTDGEQETSTTSTSYGSSSFSPEALFPTADDIRAAKKLSDSCDRKIKSDWKKENKFIKLLLLGPGEAGKSTLIRQMQIINGEDIDTREKMARIPYIRQNIFDSMVAILVAMKQFGIPLSTTEMAERAECILSHSQVYDQNLTSKDILSSLFLQSDEFFEHVSCLWDDARVKEAYGRSSEYQLLDCAAYFFDRIDAIKQHDYIPSEQDCLRCRVMTTSITETTIATRYKGRKINFKVLDVGGQQGERRKWITLFDQVTAVLYVTDASCFDQTLREDSQSNRLLESLKVFYQVIRTKYLQSVSILTFMNKIDILKEKIENGANFQDALEKMKEEARLNASCDSDNSVYDRQIYNVLYEILKHNPYSTFKVTDQDRKTFSEAFPAPEPSHDHNHNTMPNFGNIISRRLTRRTTLDINEDVVKAATYMRMLLEAIIERVKDSYYCPLKINDSDFRSYVFYYTCAVDRNTVKKVLDGCNNIIVNDHLHRMGITAR